MLFFHADSFSKKKEDMMKNGCKIALHINVRIHCTIAHLLTMICRSFQGHAYF